MAKGRILALGIVLSAGVASAGRIVYLSSAGASPGAADTANGDAEKVPVRLFKDPMVVTDFTVQTIDGRTISSADLRGKVTLVNFWATWCPPCRAEIPDLIALQDKYRDHLQIIGISEDEGALEAVRAFVVEHKMNYAVVMATRELERAFPGVTGLPTSFVVDGAARIVQKHVGILNATTTEHETRALAGLPINATIEYVDREQPVGLANAAQAREIPGIDLARLSPEKRVETLQRLNAEACTCGCGLTVAKCRVDDPSCGVSLPRARKIADEIVAAP
jgi:thiol-disulfide isomerase/thioredoxin